MRTGINHEHRSEGLIREELGLPPQATDNQVILALLERMKRIEAKLDLIEKAQKRDNQWAGLHEQER